MNNFDLLSFVQPPDGWFAVIGIHQDKSVRQTLVATREEVDKLTAKLVAQERNVFFGVAKFATDANRTKSNVQSLKALWLDIDCGEGKAEIDPDTGRPKGYINQATGLRALRSFCELIGLPKPTLVNSGRGLHVYWVFNEVVTPQEWEPVAARLRGLCYTHELHVDPGVFEVARVLRIPGTFNRSEEHTSELQSH